MFSWFDDGFNGVFLGSDVCNLSGESSFFVGFHIFFKQHCFHWLFRVTRRTVCLLGGFVVILSWFYG